MLYVRISRANATVKELPWIDKEKIDLGELMRNMYIIVALVLFVVISKESSAMQIIKLNEIELACKNLYGAIGEFESRQKLTDECIERAEKNSELGRQLKTWIRAKMEWELFGPHCEALLKRGGWFEHCTPDNRNKIPKR